MLGHGGNVGGSYRRNQRWCKLRQGEGLGASGWGGENCEEHVCGQKPPGVENLLITGKENL